MTAAAGALMAFLSGAPVWGVLLLTGAIGAFLLHRSWNALEEEYRRAVEAGLEAERREQRSVRTEQLPSKRGPDEGLVAPVEREELWIGETADQLRNAYGEPDGVDVKPMKTRTREIWKYGRTGRNRYSTRITLDNGTVVRWQRREPATRSSSPDETHP